MMTYFEKFFFTPPSLRIRCPIPTQRAADIIKKARQDLVKERIRIINNKLTHYNTEKDHLEDELFSKVSSQVQSDITQHTTWIRESTHEKVKQRHLDKFERVMARNTNKEPDLSGTQLKRWVINLSKYQLTDSQTKVLAKGLKSCRQRKPA